VTRAALAALLTSCSLLTPLDDLKATPVDASLETSADTGGDSSACPCKPTTLATGQPEPDGLVVGATDIFWTTSDSSGNGSVMRASKTDGSGMTSVVSNQYAGPLALVSEELIGVGKGFGAASIFAIPGASIADASASNTLTTVPYNLIYTLAFDGAYVYFGAYDSTNKLGAYVVPIGGGPGSLIAATTVIPPLTTGNGFVYFYDGSSIMRATSSGAPTAVVTGVADVGALTFETTSSGPMLAWTSSLAGTVSVAPADATSQAPAPIASVQAGPADIALDATRAYWTNGNDGTIVYCDLSACTPSTVAANQAQPQDIAVDATFIYWANQSSASILKIAKP
jgi:hypothetical protein